MPCTILRIEDSVGNAQVVEPKHRVNMDHTQATGQSCSSNRSSIQPVGWADAHTASNAGMSSKVSNPLSRGITETAAVSHKALQHSELQGRNTQTQWYKVDEIWS
jgi:hypothetical protein